MSDKRNDAVEVVEAVHAAMSSHMNEHGPIVSYSLARAVVAAYRKALDAAGYEIRKKPKSRQKQAQPSRLTQIDRKFLLRASDGPLIAKRADQRRTLERLQAMGYLEDPEDEGIFGLTDADAEIISAE